MATYCGHSNAPAEYALKERSIPNRQCHNIEARTAIFAVIMTKSVYFVYVTFYIVATYIKQYLLV